MIYFGYGIGHSSEGALTRSSPDKEPDLCKSTSTQRDSMSPEKEAFLYTKQEDGDDEDCELWYWGSDELQYCLLGLLSELQHSGPLKSINYNQTKNEKKQHCGWLDNSLPHEMLRALLLDTDIWVSNFQPKQNKKT